MVKVAMNAKPRLFRPRPALTDHIDYFGYWEREAGPSHKSRALPRGAATVVIALSPRPYADFYAADGETNLRVPAAFVVGPGSASYVTSIDAGQAAMTIHFLPGGLRPFAGLPLGPLEDFCIGLAEIWGRDGNRLHDRLIETPSAAARIALVEEFLLARMDTAAYRRPDVAAAMAAIETDPSIRISDVRVLAGLSTKRLVARFRDEVGLSPKTYARVRRFQASLRRLDAGVGQGAEIAHELGYFDQAHFVREFRSFTTATPTEYLQRRSWLPSHLGLERHKYPIPPTDRRRMITT